MKACAARFGDGSQTEVVLDALCRRGCNSSSPMHGDQGGLTFARVTVPIGKGASVDLSNITYFTFVRDPAERWSSAIYELARRDGGAVLAGLMRGHNVTGLSGESLARLILRVQSERRHGTIDGHLNSQTNFVRLLRQTPSHGDVIPSLRYVGRVETMAEDFAALMDAHFGLGAAKAVALLEHSRNSKDPAYYSRTLTNAFANATPFAPSTTRAIRPQVQRLYPLDTQCLGYL